MGADSNERRYRSSSRRAQLRPDTEVQKAFDQAIRNIYQMADQIGININRKDILRRAGNVAKQELKARASEIQDTGNLKKSVAWVLNKIKSAVYVGYNYKNKGRHGHLIEYGWTDRGGGYVPGYGLVKKTFEATKEQVLKNLIEESKKIVSKAANDNRA
jgi:hypothetical protein